MIEIDRTAAAVAILAFVTVQRLLEMRLAHGNSRRLLGDGAVEFGRGHYPFIVALHLAWLATLWWWAPGQPISIPLLVLFGLLQLGRLWVIATLGPRWTTRIIVIPGKPLVRSGPYRYVSHPNYLIVAMEIAVLPMVFGLWQAAVIFTLSNAFVLTVRIRAEDKALGSLRG